MLLLPPSPPFPEAAVKKLLRTRRSFRCAKPQVPAKSRYMPGRGLALEGNWNLFKEHGPLAPQSVPQSATLNCFCCGKGGALSNLSITLFRSNIQLPAHLALDGPRSLQLSSTLRAGRTCGRVSRIEFLSAYL